MTRDQNPLIDIPDFISTPIQNMVSEMAGGDHSFLKQICKAIQNIDFSETEHNDFCSPRHKIILRGLCTSSK